MDDELPCDKNWKETDVDDSGWQRAFRIWNRQLLEMLGVGIVSVLFKQLLPITNSGL